MANTAMPTIRKKDARAFGFCWPSSVSSSFSAYWATVIPASTHTITMVTASRAAQAEPEAAVAAFGEDSSPVVAPHGAAALGVGAPEAVSAVSVAAALAAAEPTDASNLSTNCFILLYLVQGSSIWDGPCLYSSVSDKRNKIISK